MQQKFQQSFRHRLKQSDNIKQRQQNIQKQSQSDQQQHQKQQQIFGQQQSIKLQILIAIKSLVQIQIPQNWTLNQVKCILIQMFPVLDFNKFQLQYQNAQLHKKDQKQNDIKYRYLNNMDKEILLKQKRKKNKPKLPGNTKIRKLLSNQLIVVQCSLPQQFQKYYHKTISRTFNQHYINTTSSLYPILHPNLSSHLFQTASQCRQMNFQQHQAHLQNGNLNQQQNGIRIINIIRLFGIIALSNILFQLASVFQIFVLIGVVLVYILMENYVNQNQRRRRNQNRNQRIERIGERLAERMRELEGNHNDNQRRRGGQENILGNNLEKENQNKLDKENFVKEQKVNNQQELINKQNQQKHLQQSQSQFLIKQKIIKKKPIKAKLILCLAFIIQAIYCYVLSIFPNWTVQTHLHANQNKMNRVIEFVKNLDPEASQMIKNWKAKQTNKIKNNKLHNE